MSFRVGSYADKVAECHRTRPYISCPHCNRILHWDSIERKFAICCKLVGSNEAYAGYSLGVKDVPWSSSSEQFAFDPFVLEHPHTGWQSLMASRRILAHN